MWYKDLFIELKKFYKSYLKESKKYDFDWAFINLCWQKDYREAQYIAIAYLEMNYKHLTKDDVYKLEELITNKSWWETVDSLDAAVGNIILENRELEHLMLKWSTSDNMWLRRVSIDYQQRYNENTNYELLEKIILNNLGSNEFFINKAIGWSLREYSKTNPTWVKSFIDKNKDNLSKLSIKEGSKYL